MRKLITLLSLLILFSCLYADKMLLSKVAGFGKTSHASLAKSYAKPRIHPYLNLLNEQSSPKQSKLNNDRLLVLLVDFQTESPDDPNTTGNGGFILQPDPNYLYSIASPPHNREYFEANLDAMRYYYLAVSDNSYNLKFDVYPKDAPAYTLSYPMGYYNPPDADSELFVSRMEEYFKEAFETADQLDPEIDFSAYGHFMIIHAGSDWQHDVAGDTPSDIPSFFIRVGSGKEAVVDDGNFLISHACNVPSTISQDFSIIESDTEPNVHQGYGALNAVLAHEFGHSLGMVDLYNVYDYRPMVGMFDIMDSGGSGVLVDSLSNGDLVFVEGALPALPGAFSRNLMFRDHYLSKGLLKEFPAFQLFSPQSLSAASFRQTDANRNPHTYKIPLNEDEYLLIENRNVDPDGDGGTALFSALDQRVILYPTPFDDPTNTPTYEYDYLLPSFVKSDGSAVGGGVLVWHVNEKVIYDEGHSYSDGSWVSNFDSNTININSLRRGVSVIEADGLTDLGSDYSMYWTGTPYEYFHAKKPVLDGNGSFVSWSQQDWRPSFNADTKPPLEDSFGLPGMYHLGSIGNPSATMSFATLSGFFDTLDVFDFQDSTLITAPIINSGFSDYDLPAIHSGSIDLLSNIDGSWQNLMGTFNDSISQYSFRPMVADNNNDGFKELITVNGSYMRFIDFADVQLNVNEVYTTGSQTTEPLVLGDAVYFYSPSLVFSPILGRIQNYRVTHGTLPGNDVQKLAGWDNKLVALGSNSVCIHDTTALIFPKRINLPDHFGSIDPLIYKSQDSELVYIFVMSDTGNLYRIHNDEYQLIFRNHGSAKPGQLGLTKLGNISPVVFFGLGNELYAMKSDGTLLSGFPYSASQEVSEKVSPLSLRLNDAELMYFPLEQSGFIAIDQNARMVADKSLVSGTPTKDAYLYFHPEKQKLYWYYPDSEGRLFVHGLGGFNANPIVFGGFRNGNSGVFTSPFQDESLNETAPFAYLYPNPVNKPYFRLRLGNYSGETSARLYDISGNLIRSFHIPESLNNPHEIEVDSKGLSSGVYILSLENGNQHKRLKFAVEK